MRLLVTGADGLLGSNLVRLLLDRGHEVSVLVHPSSKSITLNGLNIKRHVGDILNPETLNPAVKGVDAVIHAAASTSIWPARSETVRRINIEGTRNMIDAVLNHDIKRMIYIGSVNSRLDNFGSSGKYLFPAAKYGLDYIDSKYEALNMLLDAVKTKGLPALAILPTLMIGPYDSLPSSGKIIMTLAQGKLKFYTGGGRNFVHAKDVSAAIANSLEMGRVGEFYVAGNENLTYQEFFRKVAKIVSKPEPSILTPDWLVKTIGFFGSLSGDILRKEPLITYPLALLSCDKQFVSSESAVKELNMPQTDIEVAIKECYDWFTENGYLKKQ
jgi:dihydroflavonol-4-reductase